MIKYAGDSDHSVDYERSKIERQGDLFAKRFKVIREVNDYSAVGSLPVDD